MRRILYVAGLDERATSKHRLDAFKRLGMDVFPFNTEPYVNKGNWLSDRIRVRLQIGSSIDALNRDLLKMATDMRPDVVWFDKAIFVQAGTVRRLREHGFFTAHYNPDNPFVAKPEPGWRLFRSALPEYDVHFVPRKVNLAQYSAAGARNVSLMYFAYEPTLHSAPPEGWSDKDRHYDVVFVGSPHDNRSQFVAELVTRYGIPVKVWGDSKWKRKLPSDMHGILQSGSVWNEAYRDVIWRSRICLGFLTHSNEDELAHRAFEIAACHGFLLAEDSPGHREVFSSYSGAAFFRSVQECAHTIRRFLPDEAARSEIAERGYRAVKEGRCSNDERLLSAIAHIESIRRVS